MKFVKERLGILTALLVAASVAFVADPGAAGAAKRRCEKSAVQVRLAPGDTSQYTVVGWLCARGQPAGKTVQLLIPGLTYSHQYWDMPYATGQYSYVDAAIADGYATFAVDRLGVGASDKPPADKVTLSAQAYVTHQLVSALRDGAVGATKFRRVVGVGHSLGAAIWMIHPAYVDVDGLILTSYLHQVNVVQQQAIAATLRPAWEDARFSTRPDGYFTTAPGTRFANFYHQSSADEGTVALDEAMKDTATAGERATLSLARNPVHSEGIQVPVLLVVGDHDGLACGLGAELSCASAQALCHRESRYWPETSHLSAVLIPDTGHSLALHRGAPTYFAKTSAWIHDLTRGKPHLPDVCGGV